MTSRAATTGFGDAFAGRGASLNEAIEALNPFFLHLTPVMQNLADPRTDLDQFFRALGRASARGGAGRDGAGRRCSRTWRTPSRRSSASRRRSRQTIEKSPPTIDTSIASFRVQRPFLDDFADLSRRLRPAAQELPRSLPGDQRGAQGRHAGPAAHGRAEREPRRTASTRSTTCSSRPGTLLALRDIRTALAAARPAVEFIAPYQTVCNYTVYFLHPLGEVQSQVQNGPTGGGTVLSQGVKLVNQAQPNNYGTTIGSRPVDIPSRIRTRSARRTRTATRSTASTRPARIRPRSTRRGTPTATRRTSAGSGATG